jgi:hypothetical protein
MFKIENEPTFPGSITIKSAGRVQKMEVTFRAKTVSEYKALVDSEKNGYDIFLALVEKWDADLPLDKASLEKLDDHQPGAIWRVIEAYQEAMIAARQGN